MSLAKGMSDLAEVIDRILGINKIEQQADEIVRDEAQRKAEQLDAKRLADLERNAGT